MVDETVSTETRVLNVFSMGEVRRRDDGSVWGADPLFSEKYWQPFFTVFDRLVVHSRQVHEPILGECEIDSPLLEFREIPGWKGIGQFLRRRRTVLAYLSKHAGGAGTYTCVFLPSLTAGTTSRSVKRKGGKLLAIVVGDGFDVGRALAPKGFRHLASIVLGSAQRRAVRRADVVVYVTNSQLQKRFPAANKAMTVARSDVLLPPKHDPHVRVERRTPLAIVAVGSQEVAYKGHDLLIEATRRLQQRGLPVTLTIVGDGRLHDSLVSQVSECGLEDVAMVRRVGGPADVSRLVARHDLFIMPSLTEGLPRALVEAMNAGVLCLGSKVGGIPELIEGEALFRPGSVDEIVGAIEKVAVNDDLARELLARQQEVISKFRARDDGDSQLRTVLRELVRP